MTDATAPLLLLEERRNRALVEGDAATLAEIMLEDCVVQHGSGKTETRTPYLANVWKRLAIASAQTIVSKIDVIGDVAVVSGVHAMRVRVIADGIEREARANLTAIYRRLAGDWKLMLVHHTRIPAE